jgi:hypothetical protein
VCVILLATVGLTGCVETTAPPAGTSTSANSIPYVQTSGWAAEGQALIAAKVAAAASADATASPTDVAAGEPAWAYLSEPVNVTANGQLQIDVKVPATFHIELNAGNEPTGFSYYYPPDIHFQIYPETSTRVVTASGGVEVRITATIADLKAPYPGFECWIY